MFDFEEVYKRHGPRLLIFRRAEWNKMKRIIKRLGSKRLQAALKELDIIVTPVDLTPPPGSPKWKPRKGGM